MLQEFFTTFHDPFRYLITCNWANSLRVISVFLFIVLIVKRVRENGKLRSSIVISQIPFILGIIFGVIVFLHVRTEAYEAPWQARPLHISNAFTLAPGIVLHSLLYSFLLTTLSMVLHLSERKFRLLLIPIIQMLLITVSYQTISSFKTINHILCWNQLNALPTHYYNVQKAVFSDFYPKEHQRAHDPYAPFHIILESDGIWLPSETDKGMLEKELFSQRSPKLILSEYYDEGQVLFPRYYAENFKPGYSLYNKIHAYSVFHIESGGPLDTSVVSSLHSFAASITLSHIKLTIDNATYNCETTIASRDSLYAELERTGISF